MQSLNHTGTNSYDQFLADNLNGSNLEQQWMESVHFHVWETLLYTAWKEEGRLDNTW